MTDAPEQAGVSIPVGVHLRTGDDRQFVVVHGRATVELEEIGALVVLRRGTLCALPSAATARWTVAEAIELLPVTEASMAFQSHEATAPAQPFRPRRIVSPR